MLHVPKHKVYVTVVEFRHKTITQNYNYYNVFYPANIWIIGSNYIQCGSQSVSEIMGNSWGSDFIHNHWFCWCEPRFLKSSLPASPPSPANSDFCTILTLLVKAAFIDFLWICCASTKCTDCCTKHWKLYLKYYYFLTLWFILRHKLKKIVYD